MSNDQLEIRFKKKKDFIQTKEQKKKKKERIKMSTNKLK